jgi:hypothetical protein
LGKKLTAIFTFVGKLLANIKIEEVLDQNEVKFDLLFVVAPVEGASRRS